VLAGAALVLLLLVLGVAQLVLPGIAERRLTDQLTPLGSRPTVSVKAFPAVKLLFHRADEVRVTMASARTGSGTALADQLQRTRDVGRLDVRVGILHAGILTVRDARLRKRDGELTADGTVRDADLASALPPILQGVRAAPQQDGDGLVLDGVLDVPFVGRIQAQARVTAVDGAIITRAENIPLLDQLASLTIFQDPRVTVQAVAARQRTGGFDLTASGRLVG
jgi:hypothetical protein